MGTVGLCKGAAGGGVGVNGAEVVAGGRHVTHTGVGIRQCKCSLLLRVRGGLQNNNK